MPISSKDFTVVGASSSDLAKLDHALRYIQNEMPTHGAPALEQAAKKGLTIVINHNGTNNYGSIGEIHWDPTKALVAQGADGTAKGVNSAALILLHELMHALDPNYIENVRTPDAQYDTRAERVATEKTAEAGREAGEVVRENHSGGLIVAPNPTEHTGNPDGYWGLHWIEFDTNIEIDIGPLANLDSIGPVAPTIGGGSGPPKDDDKHVKQSSIEPSTDAYNEIGMVGVQSQYDLLYIA